MMTDIAIIEEARPFFTDDSMNNGSDPAFVLLIGSVGSGKTTIRKQQYSGKYVQLDAASIRVQQRRECVNKEQVEELAQIVMKIGQAVANRAVAEHRNIVTEIVGPEALAKEMIDAMLSQNYKVEVVGVNCDPVEAYKRHVNAVKNDPDYVSAHHIQWMHREWILQAAKSPR